jgi:hypothetical protein
MGHVPQKQLQGMGARQELEARLGLTATEVPMVVVGRQGPIQCRRLCQVDQQVMVPGTRLVHPGGRGPHAFKTEADRHRTGDRLPVDGRDYEGLAMKIARVAAGRPSMVHEGSAASNACIRDSKRIHGVERCSQTLVVETSTQRR